MCRGRICLRRRRDFGSRCGPSVTELCGILGFRDAADFEDEVGDDGEVDQQEQDLEYAGVMENLIDLERDEAGGGDDREDFSPTLTQEQADGLGEEERTIGEGADA